MKAIYSALFFVFFTSLTQAQDAFITQWQTSSNVTGNPYVTIPTHPDETYDYNVDWGDGTIQPTKAVMPHMSMPHQAPKP